MFCGSCKRTGTMEAVQGSQDWRERPQLSFRDLCWQQCPQCSQLSGTQAPLQAQVRSKPQINCRFGTTAPSLTQGVQSEPREVWLLC